MSACANLYDVCQDVTAFASRTTLHLVRVMRTTVAERCGQHALVQKLIGSKARQDIARQLCDPCPSARLANDVVTYRKPFAMCRWMCTRYMVVSSFL